MKGFKEKIFTTTTHSNAVPEGRMKDAEGGHQREEGTKYGAVS
jgi:hypothetical protein